MKRSEIYLDVAELIDKNTVRDCAGFCDHAAHLIYGNSMRHGEITESSFPEIFLFKDRDSAYWLTEYGITDYVERMNIRIIAILFAHEIAKSNGN